MFIGVILVQLKLGQSCKWDFGGVASHITRRQSIQGNSNPLALRVLLLFLLLRSLSLSGNVLSMCSLGLGSRVKCSSVKTYRQVA